MVATSSGTVTDTARPRSVLRLWMHQFRYDLMAFARNGQSRFFTVALPVIFLVIFASIFGGDHSV
jgi:ABC-2 type transport system permease protein